MCACYSERCGYLHVPLWSSSCINSAHLYCSEFALEIASEFAPVFLTLFQPELTVSPVFALVLSSLAVLKNIDGMLPCSMFFLFLHGFLIVILARVCFWLAGVCFWLVGTSAGLLEFSCLVGRNFLLAERIL